MLPHGKPKILTSVAGQVRMMGRDDGTGWRVLEMIHVGRMLHRHEAQIDIC